MLTAEEHIAITRDLLIAVNHRDQTAADAALARIFAPGTDPRDGYVLASGLIAGITAKIPRPGSPLGLRILKWTPDGIVPGDIDEAGPHVRAMARWMVAYVNRDHETAWAIWMSVVDAGPQATGELLADLTHQAAAVIPCPAPVNGVAAAFCAVVLVVVVSAWPAAALVVLAAEAIDRRPAPPERPAARHRCAGENNDAGCSHIPAAAFSGPTPAGDR